MSIVEIVLIALGLSMDAFAVSVGRGLAMRRTDLKQAAALAFTFGLFQGVMPVIGWAVGTQLAALIAAVDHWIAFVLLALIGGKMIQGAFTGGAGAAEPAANDRLQLRTLLVLGVATSIDALAAGIGFAFLGLDIWTAAGLIAGITCTLSFVGVLIGRRFGAWAERPAQIAGGLILIVIGLRILLSHLGVWA